MSHKMRFYSLAGVNKPVRSPYELQVLLPLSLSDSSFSVLKWMCQSVLYWILEGDSLQIARVLSECTSLLRCFSFYGWLVGFCPVNSNLLDIPRLWALCLQLRAPTSFFFPILLCGNCLRDLNEIILRLTSLIFCISQIILVYCSTSSVLKIIILSILFYYFSCFNFILVGSLL